MLRKFYARIPLVLGRITPDHVKALIRVGVLSHLRFGSALRYPRRAEIADLLRAVEMLPCSQRFSGAITLKSFCATRSISLAHVVAAWRDGELDGLVTRGEGRGLEALHFVPEAFCDKVAPCLDRDLSLAATARYLRISLTAIRKLRDVGLLRQIRKRNTDTNFWQGYISRSSIHDFECDHVTLGQLAERNGLAPTHLARRMDFDGIPALDTPYGMVRVYRRAFLSADLLGETQSASGVTV